MNFNKTILGGHLCRDPELKYTPKGTAVARITIAVNRTWKGADGQQKSEASFIDCDAWGRTAECIGQYFKSGQPILIDGRLKQETWQDKQTNETRSKLKVVVESFSFVEKKQPGQRDSESPAPLRDTSRPGDAGPDTEEDDVPF